VKTIWKIKTLFVTFWQVKGGKKLKFDAEGTLYRTRFSGALGHR
jgi:hypothetical protein